MSVNFEIGDVLPPPPAHRDSPAAVPVQRRHLEPAPHPHRRVLRTPRGPRRARPALAPEGRARRALRQRGPRPRLAGHTKLAYRLRKPVYAPADLAYTARVTAAEGDSLTLEVIEGSPSGDLGFEGRAWVSRTPGATP